MSSIAEMIGIPFQAFCSASKFALQGFGEALAYSRRMARAAAGDDAYRTALDSAVGQMARDEENGAPPEAVAAVVHRVLRSSRPPRRVSVGKAGERAGLLAKRILPFRAFQAAAKGSLGA
ncbi:MAG TPA: hypothetical protein VNF47_24120 [Streptosporangiaceae bacterium]|nr:hypothetical protein [Streptosporangiaceae bacterium]